MSFRGRTLFRNFNVSWLIHEDFIALHYKSIRNLSPWILWIFLKLILRNWGVVPGVTFYTIRSRPGLFIAIFLFTIVIIAYAQRVQTNWYLSILFLMFLSSFWLSSRDLCHHEHLIIPKLLLLTKTFNILSVCLSLYLSTCRVCAVTETWFFQFPSMGFSYRRRYLCMSSSPKWIGVSLSPCIHFTDYESWFHNFVLYKNVF